MTALCDFRGHGRKRTASLWQRARKAHGLGWAFRPLAGRGIHQCRSHARGGLRAESMAVDMKHILCLGRGEERPGTAGGSNAIWTILGARGRL